MRKAFTRVKDFYEKHATLLKMVFILSVLLSSIKLASSWRSPFRSIARCHYRNVGLRFDCGLTNVDL